MFYFYFGWKVVFFYFYFFFFFWVEIFFNCCRFRFGFIVRFIGTWDDAIDITGTCEGIIHVAGTGKVVCGGIIDIHGLERSGRDKSLFLFILATIILDDASITGNLSVKFDMFGSDVSIFAVLSIISRCIVMSSNDYILLFDLLSLNTILFNKGGTGRHDRSIRSSNFLWDVVGGDKEQPFDFTLKSESQVRQIHTLIFFLPKGTFIFVLEDPSSLIHVSWIGNLHLWHFLDANSPILLLIKLSN